jgi:protein-serine/threonine kinase
LLLGAFESQYEEASASNSNSNSNTNSSGKSSGPTIETNTTEKTSLDSKLSKSSTQTNSGDKKQLRPTASVIRRPKEPELDSRDSPLEPIIETALDQLAPTIKTVEKAAAAKIYLETYFNNALCKSSPRFMRLQYLKAELYRSKLSPQERAFRRKSFDKRESDHLRETRVLMAQSTGSTLRGLPNKLADGYENLKILGKGSFGVVRLVREKSPDELERPTKGQPVYAMKVIRKSAMLRTSQEGHLRAERDFLVSSDGSDWYEIQSRPCL